MATKLLILQRLFEKKRFSKLNVQKLVDINQRTLEDLQSKWPLDYDIFNLLKQINKTHREEILARSTICQYEQSIRTVQKPYFEGNKCQKNVDEATEYYWLAKEKLRQTDKTLELFYAQLRANEFVQQLILEHNPECKIDELIDACWKLLKPQFRDINEQINHVNNILNPSNEEKKTENDLLKELFCLTDQINKIFETFKCDSDMSAIMSEIYQNGYFVGPKDIVILNLDQV